MGGQRDVDDAPPITAYGFDAEPHQLRGHGAKALAADDEAEPGRRRPDRRPDLGRTPSGSARASPGCSATRLTTGFIDAALGFIDSAQAENKPFYINLWPDDVHGPFWPPLDKWGGDKRALYRGVLDSMDEQFAKLFDRIRNDEKLRDNTIIMVCSDNGHEQGAGSSDPLRGAKTWLYDGGIRSPLIVWAPGLIDSDVAGSKNDASLQRHRFEPLALHNHGRRATGTARRRRPVDDCSGEGKDQPEPADLLAPPARPPGFRTRLPRGQPGPRRTPRKMEIPRQSRRLASPQLYDLPADPARVEQPRRAEQNPRSSPATVDKAVRAVERARCRKTAVHPATRRWAHLPAQTSS